MQSRLAAAGLVSPQEALVFALFGEGIYLKTTLTLTLVRSDALWRTCIIAVRYEHIVIGYKCVWRAAHGIRLGIDRPCTGGLAAVVAIDAGTGNACVAKCRWCPSGRLMAVFAYITGSKMICRLTFGLCTVMARHAVRRNAIMIEGRWRPSVRLMAILANVICLEMICRFADRLRTVVA